MIDVLRLDWAGYVCGASTETIEWLEEEAEKSTNYLVRLDDPDLPPEIREGLRGLGVTEGEAIVFLS